MLYLIQHPNHERSREWRIPGCAWHGPCVSCNSCSCFTKRSEKLNLPPIKSKTLNANVLALTFAKKHIPTFFGSLFYMKACVTTQIKRDFKTPLYLEKSIRVLQGRACRLTLVAWRINSFICLVCKHLLVCTVE